METTAVKGEWIEGCNRMNLVITSSEFAKKTFELMDYEIKNQQGQTQGRLKLTTPIEVLFEGANTNIYKVTDTPCSLDIQIKEDFAYLFVGHWMQGDLSEDRKNVGLLVKAFYEVFKNKSKKPALILKTSQVGSSYVDREEILKKIKQIKNSVNSKNLPNVYLLHGEFTDNEMNEIYNHPKVKAMVSLTKGEGFGRPLLEFTLTNKPLITTGWSGHLDFLNPEFTNLIAGQLSNVHPSAANQWLLQESQWFNPDHGQVGHYLKDVFENYKNYTTKAKRQAYKSKTEFSWDKMKEKLNDLLQSSLPDFPKEVTLKLPTVKKINLPKKVEIKNG